MTEALSGLVGVFIGAFLALFLAVAFELWRKTVEGQSAARLIRIETIENRVNVERAIKVGFRGEQVARVAWDDYRLAVTPFLSELEIMRLAWSYGLVDKINNRWLPVLKSSGRHPLGGWTARVRENARILRQVEAATPLVLVVGLVRGRRTASEDEIAEAYGLTRDEMDAMDDSATIRGRSLGRAGVNGG